MLVLGVFAAFNLSTKLDVVFFYVKFKIKKKIGMDTKIVY